MAMNSVETRNAIRDTAAEKFLDSFPEARAVNGKDYTFVIPIEVEGVTHYAKFGITSVAENATKTREAFDVENDTTPAREAFDNMIAERLANDAAKRAEKAAKK